MGPHKINKLTNQIPQKRKDVCSKRFKIIHQLEYLNKCIHSYAQIINMKDSYETQIVE